MAFIGRVASYKMGLNTVIYKWGLPKYV